MSTAPGSVSPGSTRAAADLADLGSLSRGRDNNLNLIRVIAASAVLLSHSYVISSGDRHAEPWVNTLNMTPGGVAVDAFFVLSGFLVSGSLQRGGSLWAFVKARALRIYPGLWMALLLSTLAVGLAFSSLPPSEFLRDPQTWRYLLKNALMIAGAEGALPGAFADNPLPAQVNGSLWTLRWELRLYLLLGLSWWAVGRLAPPARQAQLLGWLAPALAVVLLIGAQTLGGLGHWADALRLGAMFFSGVTYWFHRARIPVHGRFALLAGLLMAAAAAVGPRSFEAVYRLAFPYLLFYLAFVPAGPVRAYNRVGDYSYGIYVYACPLQQMTMALLPDTSTWALSAIAWPASLGLAVLSWHLLEQPALRWKDRRLTLPHRSTASSPS